jgi:hypothetical protein
MDGDFGITKIILDRMNRIFVFGGKKRKKEGGQMRWGLHLIVFK